MHFHSLGEGAARQGAACDVDADPRLEQRLDVALGLSQVALEIGNAAVVQLGLFQAVAGRHDPEAGQAPRVEKEGLVSVGRELPLLRHQGVIKLQKSSETVFQFFGLHQQSPEISPGHLAV